MNEIKKVDRVFSKTEQECWNNFFIRLYPRYLEVQLLLLVFMSMDCRLIAVAGLQGS